MLMTERSCNAKIKCAQVRHKVWLKLTHRPLPRKHLIVCASAPTTSAPPELLEAPDAPIVRNLTQKGSAAEVLVRLRVCAFRVSSSLDAPMIRVKHTSSTTNCQTVIDLLVSDREALAFSEIRGGKCGSRPSSPLLPASQF